MAIPLFAVLEKAGFSGTLTAFLRAGFANASSSVLLNGIQTQNISLARSVRQGCPLSPLLFILAFDVLSSMFQQGLLERRIVGVSFPVLGIQSLHNMVADDQSVVICAILRYIQELKRLMHLFGRVSGLVCA